MEEYLEVLVGDIGRLITGTFHVIEFILGLSYFFGETLVKWMIWLANILLEGSLQSWELIKYTGTELWDFGGGIVKGILLIYYAICLLFESFHVIIMDLKTFTVHVFFTIGTLLNDTQAAFVDHGSRIYTTVPYVICQSLIFIGETATNFVVGLGTYIGALLTRLVMVPVSLVYTLVLWFAKVVDIPFYLWDVCENIPRAGKAGVVVIAVLVVIYWNINFIAIPRRSWNLVKSSYFGIFKICNFLKCFKSICQQALLSGGRSTESDTKALCVICQDATVSFISMPCKHVCLCYSCVKALVDVDDRCPLCRGVVTKFEKVYIPL